MHSNLKLRLAFASTGIQVEAVDESGQVLAAREISAAKVFHWVANHADRASAVSLDTAITFAIERDEEAHGRFRQPPADHGNLVGLFDQCALINRLASGLEEIAS